MKLWFKDGAISYHASSIGHGDRIDESTLASVSTPKHLIMSAHAGPVTQFLVILQSGKSLIVSEPIKFPVGLLESPTPSTGLVMSTSGSSGQRRWIFHPWEQLLKRVKSTAAPQYSCACFLSLGHAAGIEALVRHYYYQAEVGFYSPRISPLEALVVLQQQRPQALSLTPSSLWRLMSYPPLRHWIQENIKLISLGGEAVWPALEDLIKRELSSVQCKSVYGSTETWSIQTQTGHGLAWHRWLDQETILSDKSAMAITSPYLFTHEFVAGEYLPRTEESYLLGDELSWNGDEFAISRSVKEKYHGLQTYPDEWESELKEQFSLPWAQIIKRLNPKGEQEYLGVLPLESFPQLQSIRSYAQQCGWPILQWERIARPLQSERGKQWHGGESLFTTQEAWRLLQLYQLEATSLRSIGQDYFSEGAFYSVFRSEKALVCYPVSNHARRVHYVANSLTDLLPLLSYLPSEMVIALPHELRLTDDWEEIGSVQRCTLELPTWQDRWGGENLGEYIEKLAYQFDDWLTPMEGILLETLQGKSAWYYQNEKGQQGLCCFAFFNSSYYGLFMANRGLPLRVFYQLCSQGLSMAKKRGFSQAKSAVQSDNQAAKVIHTGLGFSLLPVADRLWRKRG